MISSLRIRNIKQWKKNSLMKTVGQDRSLLYLFALILTTDCLGGENYY